MAAKEVRERRDRFGAVHRGFGVAYRVATAPRAVQGRLREGDPVTVRHLPRAARLRCLEDGRDGRKAALARGLGFAISGGLGAVGGGPYLHAAPRRAVLELAWLNASCS